jgi:hypothetical protein
MQKWGGFTFMQEEILSSDNNTGQGESKSVLENLQSKQSVNTVYMCID